MEAVFTYRSWRDKAGSLREGCVGVHRFARRQAALEEKFMLSAIPLDVGPDGLLGMEQSNKTAQFSVKDSSRTLILSGVRAMG